MNTKTLAVAGFCSVALLGAMPASWAQTGKLAQPTPTVAEVAAKADAQMSNDVRIAQNAKIERILRSDRKAQQSICRGC